jgi:ribonuclease HII
MAVRPSLKRERAAWAEELLLVGVDEAGRGPLAGPVVAAAVVFPARCSAVRGLRDSKVLPARVRLRLAIRIRERALAFAVGAASSREIDRLNIRVATALAMRRAIARLITRGPFAGTRVPHRILIDGLPLPEIGFGYQCRLWDRGASRGSPAPRANPSSSLHLRAPRAAQSLCLTPW